MASSQVRVEMDGRELVLSNLDKVLYPAAQFHKAEVIDYYRRIGPVILDHLAGRPPTLVRAPDGPDGERFFEKRCPPHHPDWVPTEAVVAGGGQQGCVVEEVATLVWLANLAALELHTHQWTVADPWHPTAVVFDLDPGPSAGIVECGRVALELRELLDQFDLRVVVKTSGGKGLHLSVPLNTGTAEAEDTKRFALAVGQLLERRDPKHVTVDMAKERRTGQRVRRLEPERQLQNDGVRVLPAHPRETDGVDTGVVGGDLRRRRQRRRLRAPLRDPRRARPRRGARRPVRRHAHVATGTPSPLGRLQRQTARRCSRVRLPAAWDRFH